MLLVLLVLLSAGEDDLWAVPGDSWSTHILYITDQQCSRWVHTAQHGQVEVYSVVFKVTNPNPSFSQADLVT